MTNVKTILNSCSIDLAEYSDANEVIHEIDRLGNMSYFESEEELDSFYETIEELLD